MRSQKQSTVRHTASIAFALALLSACQFDKAYRDLEDTQQALTCKDGELSCSGALLLQCTAGTTQVLSDCGATGKVCSNARKACLPCDPGARECAEGQKVLSCNEDGQRRTQIAVCNTQKGEACREGACVNLCEQAAREQSNIGCTYWAVDLDNAVTPQGNAAAQQFAVVVSNPQPDVVANITVYEDTSVPGAPSSVRKVSSAIVQPRSLEVFKLGPREVDGSPEGTFNTGTHTALTRGAFKVVSDVPIVAYQFNPLENVNVFSNDASQLLPQEALGAETSEYVIASWPQTIARSEDPATNFDFDLRAFLSVVGTQPGTRVRIKTTTRIVPGGPVPLGAEPGTSLEFTLEPHEVLNLETGGFNADFTGTTVSASGPVVVYAGSEASDAPIFSTLAERSCCADHLEDQVVPLRAVGRKYALGHVPNRSKAVAAAGARLGVVPEPEYYRVVSTTNEDTLVSTTLKAPNDNFILKGMGASRILTAFTDFTLVGDKPVIVANVQASQEAAGVPRGLPGGDPSLTYVPSTEQWRNDYVLLTPDKYAFDFLVITAPYSTKVYLDGQLLTSAQCEIGDGDGLSPAQRGKPNPPYEVYRCQLSFPVVDPDKTSPNNVSPGRQNDGVHRVQADFPVGVLVYGFDAFVSYAYAGGTDLRAINVR
jgi:hypothetical protein